MSLFPLPSLPTHPQSALILDNLKVIIEAQTTCQVTIRGGRMIVDGVTIFVTEDGAVTTPFTLNHTVRDIIKELNEF